MRHSTGKMTYTNQVVVSGYNLECTDLIVKIPQTERLSESQLAITYQAGLQNKHIHECLPNGSVGYRAFRHSQTVMLMWEAPLTLVIVLTSFDKIELDAD